MNGEKAQANEKRKASLLIPNQKIKSKKITIRKRMHFGGKEVAADY
jgi:hypothetical protein